MRIVTAGVYGHSEKSFFDAVANAGIVVNGSFLVRALHSPVTLGIILGYVVGKPLGVLGGSWLVTRLSRGRVLPPVVWASVAGGGTIAGIGFTVALLVAALSLQGDQLQEAKFGVLVAAVLATGLTWVVFRLTARLPVATRLRALLGSDPLLKLSGPAADDLFKSWQAWAGQGNVAGDEHFRITFRLEPPEDQSEPWKLTYLLQATDDPSLLVPAAVAPAFQVPNPLCGLFNLIRPWLGGAVLLGLIVAALGFMLRSIMPEASMQLQNGMKGVGIGLFIAMIGFVDGGFVTRVPDAAMTTVPVSLGQGGSIASWPVFIFVIGLIICGGLVVRNVRGGLFIGIIATTAIALIVQALAPSEDWGMATPAIPRS